MPLPKPDLQIERHVLSNGLRVNLHHDEKLPLVAVNVWYHVGSKNEPPGRTGLAHLFEHMLFQGSEHVDTHDHFRLIQQAGGVANGSTWYDRTNYYEILPSHYLDLALWLESDRMGFLLSAMSEEKLRIQQQVVMNERRQRVDNQPYGRGFERLAELLYPAGHPYHWPVIGYMDDIASATLDDVRSFFRRYYVPNNAVLTVAGDLPVDCLGRIERYFDSIPRGDAVGLVHAATASSAGEGREVLEDTVPLPRIYLGFRCPSIDSESWHAADLLAGVLGGGRSSPLYQDLVYRRELAKDVSTVVLAGELDSTFLLVATARPNVDAATLEQALEEHLERAVAEPFAEGDLRRAHQRVQTRYFAQLQHLEDRADLLSEYTTYFDNPYLLAEEPERYLALTATDLQVVANEYLAPHQRVSVWVVPREGT